MDFLTLVQTVGLPGAIVTFAFIALIKGWFYTKAQVDILMKIISDLQELLKSERERADVATQAMMKYKVTGELNTKLLNALPELKQTEPENQGEK